jgi:hypothetical protein
LRKINPASRRCTQRFHETGDLEISRSYAGLIVVVVIKRPASVLAVQLVNPILRFMDGRIVQLA